MRVNLCPLNWVILQTIVEESFPDITDTHFTASIEHELDEVEIGTNTGYQ